MTCALVIGASAWACMWWLFMLAAVSVRTRVCGRLVGGSRACRALTGSGAKCLRWGGDSFDLRAREWCMVGCAAQACMLSLYQ